MGEKKLVIYQNDSLYECFLEEVSQSLVKLDSILENIDKFDLDQRKFHQVFRIIHTIKGSSMALEQSDLSLFAHEAESLLLLNNEKSLLSPKIYQTVVNFNERLKIWLENREGPNGRNFIPEKKCISSLLPKWKNLVTICGQQLKKEISLSFNTVEIMLEPQQLQLIDSSIVHILINACDHGALEQSQRKNIGKNKINKLCLTITKDFKSLKISVDDDGEGVDFGSLLQAAQKHHSVSVQDQSQVLYLPFVSTKKQPSIVSGRGMGLEIVKQNMEKLGGSVEVVSTKGIGTTFYLILPIKN